MKINKIKQLLPALLSMSMTFIVLGYSCLLPVSSLVSKTTSCCSPDSFSLSQEQQDMYIRSSKSLSLVTEKLLIPR